ncbi:AAA family ATPase [Malikia sp.]|uniref:AAA family ATPase n=1 Tax=Malikia sp. TaxID=2070706 RepID=UPI00260D04C3|nr:AAA family ATPase [Malikia sp.]MDD2729731.1 AAA family ATPase [Malikia sp.]
MDFDRINRSQAMMDAQTYNNDAGFGADPMDFSDLPPSMSDQAAWPPENKPVNRVVLLSGAVMNPEPVRWLWPGWLALGKLVILGGAPGTGKTTAALSMAATVTTGGHWPDGNRCSVGDVLIWSGEDDPCDTLLPRLIAAGVDRSRVYFVSGVNVNGEIRPFDPSTDVAALLEAARELPSLKFILVDPIVSAVAGDSHKNTEVRRALQPLVDFAAAIGAALVGITHFSKGGAGSDPASRLTGSIAFAALPRVVMVCAKTKDAEGNERRILARAKSNIGPDGGGFAYSLEQCEALPGIWTSRTVWGETLEGTAIELLAEPASDTESEDSRDVCDLLRDELSSEAWTKSDLASKPVIDAGFSKKQIWSASKKLGILRRKGTDGSRDGWYWRLPGGPETGQDSEDSREDSEDSRS